jgi:hypothetical protein
MGQQFAKKPGPNDVVIVQQIPDRCCGFPPFDVNTVANDIRILNMGITVPEIQHKFEGFNTEMQTRFRHPFCFIYPGLLVGLALLIFFQTSLIPGLVKMCKEKTKLMEFSVEYWQDWVSSGLLVGVTYFPGSKHAQPSLTLHLPEVPPRVVGTAVVIPVTTVAEPPTVGSVVGDGKGEDSSSGVVSGVPVPVPVLAANNGPNQVVPIQSM